MSAGGIPGDPEFIKRMNGDAARYERERKAEAYFSVAEELNSIPNRGPANWERWDQVGMMVWRETGGSSGGWELLKAWSARNPAYDPAKIRARWDRYPVSPPAAKTERKARKPSGADRILDEYAKRIAPPPETDEALDVWDAGDDDYKITPREWLLGNTFCKKFLSSLIADGGVGKTALRIAQIASLATGRSITGEHVFRRCRALILSFEDDRDELRRRVYTAMLKHGITPADLKGWLFLAAPKGLKLAQMVEGSPEVGVLDKMLRDAITARKLDIVCLDPFVKTHGVNENDNNAIDFVCDLLAEIAIDLNCAVDVPHHTNKGLAVAGDANKGRGASAAKDAARLVYTLTPMTREEAQALGLDEGNRRFLVRYDSAKVNIAPPSIEAKWFRIVGMPLGNVTGTYPAGDNVQSVEPWIPPDAWAGTDAPTLNLVLDDLDAGLSNGQRYSHGPAADKRAAWPIVQKYYPDKPEALCRTVVQAWVKSGTLFTQNYTDPVDRKDRMGLSVNATKRP